MKYGEVSGVNKPVSRLAQGTVMIGSHDPEGSFALLDSVFELGCTVFDTAHIYGSGDVDRTLGQWMRDRGIRDKVVVIGKGAHHNADRRRLTPYDIGSDLLDILARMKTDYIDLYILHRDDPSVPVGTIVEALNEHQKAGRIHAFGGSNWSYSRLKEAADYAKAHGLTPFAASSPHFSLARQFEEPWDECVSITGEAQKEARDWYKETQMPVFSWSTVANGFFSGRFNRDNRDTFEEGSDALAMRCYGYEENFKRLDRVQQMASEKGISGSQLALAWVFNQPLNVFTLVGSRSAEEFKDNLEALNLELTPREQAWLNLEED